MRILAFDTATAATAVALALGDGTVATARHDPEPGARPGHASQLLPLVVGLLGEAGIGFAQLDRIAVGVGPGTFTGLRIGVATARGLSQAQDLPLVPVSTLRALALTADEAPAAATDPEEPDAVTLAVLDARRGEAFAAAWARGAAADPALAPLLEPAALTPNALEAAVAALPASPLAIGDGALRFHQQLRAVGARIPAGDSPLHRVDAAAHCRLAAVLEPVARDAVLPAYLRLPDAELALRRRDAERP